MVPLKKHDLSRLTAYELIDLLDKYFPPVKVLPDKTHAQLMYEGGERGVVEVLLKLKEREEND